MVELGILVKVSARKMTHVKASKQIHNVRVCVKVTAAILVVLGGCRTVNNILMVTKDEEDIQPW